MGFEPTTLSLGSTAVYVAIELIIRCLKFIYLTNCRTVVELLRLLCKSRPKFTSQATY